jgi:hypothetical protein
MNCPGCVAVMPHLALDTKIGTPVEIDLCSTCRVIWFDQFEDLQLSPAATLSVFGMISKPASQSAPLPSVLRCPRCSGRLVLTHDIQRNTKFQYWRCEAAHGRLMTFIDFLREKDFVRPLTLDQIKVLRQSVRTVNCSNCGGPIDLTKDFVCGHCGSVLSMLDPGQMARTVADLQGAASSADAHKQDFSAVVAAMKSAPRSESSRALLDVGLRVLGELLKKR